MRLFLKPRLVVGKKKNTARFKKKKTLKYLLSEIVSERQITAICLDHINY